MGSSVPETCAAANSHSFMLGVERVPKLFGGAVAATAAVIALSAQEYLGRHWGGGPISFNTMLFAQAIGAVLWLAIATTVIRPLTLRYPFQRGRFGLLAAIHTGAGLLVAALHTFIVAALFASYYYGYSPLAIRDVFRDRMHSGYAMSVLVYLLIVGVLSVRRGNILSPRAEIEPRLSEPGARRLLVKAGGRTTILPAEHVDWMEAADNNVIVHAGSTRHIVRGPLSTMAARLNPKQFVRIHRSTVVNLESVREVQPWFHGDLVVILKDQTRLTVGPTYREAFLAALEA